MIIFKGQQVQMDGGMERPKRPFPLGPGEKLPGGQKKLGDFCNRELEGAVETMKEINIAPGNYYPGHNTGNHDALEPAGVPHENVLMEGDFYGR